MKALLDSIATEAAEAAIEREIVGREIFSAVLPTCPYCGHEQRDPYEYFEHSDDIEIECGECEQTYRCSRHVSVSYNSEPQLPEEDRP